MPLPLDSRKKPGNVKIHVTSGTGVDIIWADDHVSHYDFGYLRDLCPCATCNEERVKKSAFAAAGGTSAAVLPMFKPKVRAQSATSIGNYAIQSFSATATPLEFTATIISAAFARARIAPRPSARVRSSSCAELLRGTLCATMRSDPGTARLA